MNEMPYCPILNLMPEATDNWIQCQGEKCAWYNKEGSSGRCAMLLIANSLEEIVIRKEQKL